MLQKPERNPLKIIWLSKSDILPKELWIAYGIFLCIITAIKFCMPIRVIDVDLKIYQTNQYIFLAISSLALVLSMYTFGREVYTLDDFAKFYLRNNGITYYKYLTNYLFPSLMWLVVLFFSIMRLMLIVKISNTTLEVLRVIYLSQVLLAIISTVNLVINNMNRVSNKVYMTSKSISEEYSKKKEAVSSKTIGSTVNTLNISVGKFKRVVHVGIEKLD